MICIAREQPSKLGIRFTPTSALSANSSDCQTWQAIGFKKWRAISRKRSSDQRLCCGKVILSRCCACRNLSLSRMRITSSVWLRPDRRIHLQALPPEGSGCPATTGGGDKAKVGSFLFSVQLQILWEVLIRQSVDESMRYELRLLQSTSHISCWDLWWGIQ